MAGIPINDPWAPPVFGIVFCIAGGLMWWQGRPLMGLVFGVAGAVTAIRGVIVLVKGRR